MPKSDLPTSCATANTSSTTATRRAYLRRLERDLDTLLALAPVTKDGKQLRRRYGEVPGHLLTSLGHPEVAADTISSERALLPTAIYRQVTGEFRSDWSADFYAGIRSVIGTAKCRGINAYQGDQRYIQNWSTSLQGKAAPETPADMSGNDH